MMHMITVSGTNQADALMWAKENSAGYIGNTHYGTYIVVRFKDKLDATMFALRWL